LIVAELPGALSDGAYGVTQVKAKNGRVLVRFADRVSIERATNPLRAGFVNTRNKEENMVEAAGVEPASENVTGRETTCLVAFMLPYFYGNFRSRRSERTRNASC
jgi:hypothetical protein